MEVQTKVPQSGTTLRFDADRSLEQTTGDGVLRIHGQSKDGSPVLDAIYVEVSAPEAQLIGTLIRSLRQPTPEMQEKVAQEVHALFPARLGGQDAQQIAWLTWKGISDYASTVLGVTSDPKTIGTHFENLAGRFERASAQKRQPGSFTPTGNGEYDEPRYQQQQP